MTLKAKIIFYLVAAVVTFGGLSFIYYKIDQGGYDRRTREYESALVKAKDEAQANVKKVERKYAAKIREIQESPDSGDCVGRLTSHAVDSLR